MLNDFQRRLARTVSAVRSARGFALGGGAAMIAHGFVDRSTDDLDFFTTRAEEVLGALPDIEQALRAEGIEVEQLRTYPTHVRLRATAGDEVCIIDLVVDAQLQPSQLTALGPVLSPEDVAAGKMLALFGRAEPRDFVDVHALVTHLGPERLCELAAQRDLGFDRKMFADMLGRIARLARDEFDVDADTFGEMVAFFAAWQHELLS